MFRHRNRAKPPSARRPHIGITSMRMDADTFIGRRPLETIDLPYVKRVLEAGGVPLILPTLPADQTSEVLEAVDAVLLSGGGDIDPARYSTGRPSPVDDRLIDVDPPRDEFELAMVRQVLAREIPVLAICRGLQVLNVALGGDLVADVPLHRVLERWAEPVHEVTIAPDSRLAGLLGTTTIVVNSLHHQVLGTVAPSLRAVAWAHDGVVEAVEAPAHPNVLGVQWHPEKLASSSGSVELFAWLTAACEAHAGTGGAREGTA